MAETNKPRIILASKTKPVKITSINPNEIPSQQGIYQFRDLPCPCQEVIQVLLDFLRKSFLSTLTGHMLRMVPFFFVSTSLAKLRFAGCLLDLFRNEVSVKQVA